MSGADKYGFASALREHLSAGRLYILHRWRFTIRSGRIGGFVDLSANSRKGRMRHVACILGLTAADRQSAAHHGRFASRKPVSLAPFEQVEAV